MMLNKIIRGILGAVILLHLSPLAVDAAPPSSPLHDFQVIDRDQIMLSDVFKTLGTGLDTPIGPAPKPGQDVVLNVRTLVQLARAYQVSYQPTSISDQVTIRRDGRIIDPALVTAALRQALSKHTSTTTFDIDYLSTLQPIAIPVDATPDVVVENLKFDARSGSFSADIQATDRPQTRQRIAGKVEPLVTVWVTRDTLARGALVNAGDLTEQSIRAVQMTGDTIVDLESIVGKSAKRTILAGRTIKTSDVEDPVLVHRGDKITLVYRTGTLELSAKGRAIEQGRIGDRVRVVNSDSNKPLQGTVLADARVVVD